MYKLENFLAGLAKTGHAESKELLSELNSPLETPTGEQIRERPVRRVPRSERNKVFFWQQDKAGKRKRESLINNSSNTISEENEEEEDDNETTSKPSREQSVDEGLGQLAMDENGQYRYLGKSSGYYLLQNSKTYQNGAFHFSNYGNRSKKRKTNRSENVDPLELPPKDLSEHLIFLYFRHFYPFLPMFYKRQLYSTVDHPSIQPVTPLLLNAIYAVASRISPDIRVRTDPASADTAGDIFFERAEKLLDESYDTPSIATVQSLLLLASHQHGAMKSARAWVYSGMAFRMAQDLGLHRNCDHWNIPPEERERRKRVFWCCFIVDRLTSAMYGRASTFEEKDCDIPFPSVDDDNPIQYVDSDPSTNSNTSTSSTSTSPPPFRLLDAFINLIKICDILGHVLKNIYYVRSLQYTGMRQADTVLSTWNKKLHQWKDQLPESLQINHALPSAAICQLHMIYHTTVILLHRPFIPGPNQTLRPSLLPCASICASAADAIISITMSMFAENKLRYVMNYAVYYIFTAGIIFTKNSTSSEDSKSSLDAKFKARQCMQALDEIELTWTTASKSCHILAELSGIRDSSLYNNTDETWAPPPLQHQRYLRPLSPQSSHSSPQHEYEPHSRSNSSNLRFPIIRAAVKGYDDGSKSLYSSTSLAPNLEYAVANSFANQSTSSNTMDPFAAPGIIPIPSPKQYDPLLGSAFWGVPSSLDINEWNNFMNTNLNNNHTSNPPPPLQQQQQQQQPLLPEYNNNNTTTDRQLYATTEYQPEKQHLIHTDQHVDVLSGVSMPPEPPAPTSPNSSALINYLP